MMQGIKTGATLLLLAALSVGQSKVEEGILAFQEGRYSAALLQLKDAGNERGQVFYALSEAAMGHCKEALPRLKNTSNQDATLQRLTGIAAVKCASSLGDDAGAFGSLQDLQRRYPKDPDVLYTAAKLHMKGFNDATLAMFQRTPASYRVHELSAEIFEVQNRYGEATSEYRKSIELNPKAPDLHFRLGRAILLQSHEPKSLELAAKEFQLELAVSPEDSASEFQLGQIAVVKGDRAEAKVRFTRALALSPTFVTAMVSLGKLNLSTKDYGGAIVLLTHAVQVQPDNESAHYALMTAYRNNGQMSEAKAEKVILDRLQKPPEGEFSEFLKKLGEKPVSQ